jgi:hypothetical protein
MTGCFGFQSTISVLSSSKNETGNDKYYDGPDRYYAVSSKNGKAIPVRGREGP